MKHIWRGEHFIVNGFLKSLIDSPELLAVRLTELESEGWEIFSVSVTAGGTAWIVCRK